MEPDKRRGQGYCINCDNRHGCKTRTPPCVIEMMEAGITNMSGKKYLTKMDKLDQCKDCLFLRTCWRSGEFSRLISKRQIGDI